MHQGYRVFEKLRIATTLTFISGYLNAFTYITQDGRFAGVQSGNIISLAYHLAQGNFLQAGHFLVPILSFVVGQFFTYLAKRWFISHRLPWHFGSSLIMLGLILITIVGTPYMPAYFTIALLAFIASMQIETFRRLRGAAYANVMMTGNLKNASYLWFQGMIEKDEHLRRTGRNIGFTMLGFVLGVIFATILSQKFGEIALLGILLPLLYVNYQLWKEKKPRKI